MAWAIPYRQHLDMRYACTDAGRVAALQIRNLPEDVHRTLKARAAAKGQSLSEYTAAILRAEAQTPTLEELSAQIAARGPLGTATTDDVVALIRADRERM